MGRSDNPVEEGNEKERYSIIVYRPYLGSTEVEISEGLNEALRELRCDQGRVDKREQRHCRRLERLPKHLIPQRVYPKSPETLLIERYEKSIVWRAIALLAPKQRRRLLMRYYFNIPTRNIAEHEGSSMRAVEYSLRRAKKRLKGLLTELRQAEHG